LLPAGAVAGWALHPLESAALSRRTPKTDIAMIDPHLMANNEILPFVLL
jgi:hypothetical protein